MDNPYERFAEDPIRALVAPVAWPRTYANLLYLLLGLPTGVVYFTLYVTGLSLGVGLFIVWVGAAILLSLVPITWWAILFERELAVRLLGEPVPSAGHPALPEEEGSWAWYKSIAKSPVTWKGLGFLLLKFPLGLASWTFAVVLLSLVAACVGAPVIWAAGGEIDFGVWRPDTLVETLYVSVAGVLAVIPSVHVLNGLAFLWGRFARLTLGRHEPSARVPSVDPEPATAG